MPKRIKNNLSYLQLRKLRSGAADAQTDQKWVEGKPVDENVISHWQKAFKDLHGIQGRGCGEKGDPAGWFLGTRAENKDLFARLTQDAIDAAASYRRYFHPEDPTFITQEVKHSEGYLASMDSLEHNFTLLLQMLSRYATPYTSMRYQGHMLWDTTLPGMLGYIATMLHNPNNVTVQASTLTTFLEMVVGEDLSEMIGFPISEEVEPWAHITCDGSVANLEAAWSARELKYLPMAIRYALLQDDSPYSAAKDIIVAMPTGESKKLISMSPWELLNIKMDDALQIPTRIWALLGPGRPDEPADVWQDLLHRYSVNSIGLLKAHNTYYVGESFETPAYIVPSTKHYSWPKSMAVLGFGCESNMHTVLVDADARVDLDKLRDELTRCLNQRKPVAMVVGVAGTTEEGACDPLGDIYEMREEFRQKGLDYNIHADAAWGGYLVTTLRKPYDQPNFSFEQKDETFNHQSVNEHPFIEDRSQVPLNEKTAVALMHLRKCDSVTIDPHKLGYIQYPAGALCYRNTDVKNLTTFGAPVIGIPGSEPGVGEFGIEGSKPGAAAAGVYLSHAVIRPDITGYGKLLTGSLLNAKLFYLHLFCMAKPTDDFTCTPLTRLPTEREGARPPIVAAQAKLVKDKFPKNSLENFKEQIGGAMFRDLGPDENIVDYVFNFKKQDGQWNTSLDDLNTMNKYIYDQLHVHWGTDINDYELLITQTTMSDDDYGPVFMGTYLNRIFSDAGAGDQTGGEKQNISLKVNRSVVMDPWLAETKTDVVHDFYLVIMTALRKTVTKAVRYMHECEAAAKTDSTV